LFGVGFENSHFIYSRYLQNISELKAYGFSVNEWSDLITGTGIIGFGILISAITMFVGNIISNWLGRRDSFSVFITAGVMTGIFFAVIRGLFYNTIGLPVLMFTLAVMAGVGYVAVQRKGRGYLETFDYTVINFKLSAYKRIAATCVMFIILSSLSFISIRFYIAENINRDFNQIGVKDYSSIPQIIENTINLSMGNAGYYYKIAGCLMDAVPENDNQKIEYHELAIKSLLNAIIINPAFGVYWHYLGRLLSLNKSDTGEYFDKWLPLADICYENGVRNSRNDVDILFNSARYWVWRSQMLQKGDDFLSALKTRTISRGEGIEKFQGLFEQAILLDKDRWKEAADFVWSYYKDDSIVLGIVPEANIEMKRQAIKALAIKD